MIDAGYVSFSGEATDEDAWVTLFRLAGLFLGFLLLLLPLQILVKITLQNTVALVEYESSVFWNVLYDNGTAHFEKCTVVGIPNFSLT